MKSIVVFCGSSEGYDETYREAAYELGRVLADRNIRIIYGGGRIGLMGALADGALENGGKVIGVIPVFLQTKEIMHHGLTEVIRVNTMHERKLKMHEISDAVITIPGGWGTMDEMFEMLTWAQMGLHQKPMGILNINGYYDALQALTDNMVREGFLNEEVNRMVLVSTSIEDLLQKMDDYVAPEVKQWLTRRTT
jgi:uncharacterized protein (TIGR00730 family)